MGNLVSGHALSHNIYDPDENPEDTSTSDPFLDYDDDNYYDITDEYGPPPHLQPPPPPHRLPKGKVRVEEITIVTLILILWVCAIILFVHRWGKIRMLVPHQPRYAYSQANLEKVRDSKGTNLSVNCLLSTHLSPTNLSLE